MRFLIIDDSSADRELVMNYLRREFPGSSFREVARKADFAQAISHEQYDIILTDYQLFWSNGLEIFKQLQPIYPDTPIIMFTGTGNEEVAVEGLRAGLSNYILKQHLDRLSHAIHESLEKRLLRKQYEEAIDQLRLSEERYRELFEEGLTGVFVFLPAGTLLTCNTAFARIFGFSSVEDALQASFSSLYRNIDDYASLLTLLQENRRLEYQEVEMCRFDGTPVYAVANVIGSFDEDGQLTEIKGYIFDNTEQYQLTRQLQHAQKMESIGLLVSGIAHDFNNMLGGILGHVSRGLACVQETDPVYDNLQHIQKIARRAANTTRQLTAFSGRQVLEPVDTNLNEIVENVLAFLEKMLGEQIEIVFQQEKELKNVHVDYTQIEQVLMNLCINARDAMNGKGTLTISTNNVEASAASLLNSRQFLPVNYVLLSVQDTGSGMPPEILEHIFEPFFTTKGPDKGTGLGLSMVHGIIGQHHGAIDVQSKVGEGTTFFIYLPALENAKQLESPILIKPASSTFTSGEGEQLLVVEDDPDLRFLMQEALSDYGYQVVTASDGAEGLEIFQRYGNDIALIVADLITPRMTGKELYDHIRKMNTSVRFLFVSGYQANQISQNFVLEKGFHLLRKPFDLEDLTARVQELLR